MKLFERAKESFRNYRKKRFEKKVDGLYRKYVEKEDEKYLSVHGVKPNRFSLAYPTYRSERRKLPSWLKEFGNNYAQERLLEIVEEDASSRRFYYDAEGILCRNLLFMAEGLKELKKESLFLKKSQMRR